MKNPRYYLRRIKIVCTIGPAAGSASVIERLIRAGMDVARLNLSHGALSEHTRYIETVRKLTCVFLSPLLPTSFGMISSSQSNSNLTF